MGRRGDMKVIASMALIVVVVVILLFIFNDSKNSFVASFSCQQDTYPDMYSCVPKSPDPCGSGQRVYSAVWGCEKGEVCCYKPVTVDGTTPTNQQDPVSVNMERIGPVMFSAVDNVTRRPVIEGGSLPVYVGQQKALLMDLKFPPCTDCLWYYEEIYTTKAGTVIPGGRNNKGNPYTDVEKLEQAIREVTLFNDPKYLGETITYTLLITPKSPGKDGKEGTAQRYTMNYKITSPVSVTPLSTDWARSKTMTVSCGQGIGCSDIFYVIQSNSDACTPPADKTPKTIPLTYCLLEDGVPTECGFPSIDACYQSKDAGDTEFNAVTQLVRSKAQERMLADAEMLQLLAQEQRVGHYQCQVDLSKEVGAEHTNVLLTTVMNRERQTAQIVLDRSFMANQYVCVYGKDKNDPNQYYAAGRPQLIRIDTVPPVATLEFRPFSKRLIFSCSDGDGSMNQSGCKDAYWIQYISQVDKFFPALFNGGGQNAAVWCPSYATTSGWKMETRREVLYNSPEVRVLCLRVQDNAGNAAVTKTTVYDSYDLLEAAINEYVGAQ